MTTVQPGVIERFETWLTMPRFIFWLLLLIGLNLFVYFWWMHRPVFPTGNTQSNQVIGGLEIEKRRLQDMLEQGCTGPEIQTQVQNPDLGELMQLAAVRVVTAEGHGSGFFIDKDTVLTNRHVIAGAPPGTIAITSKKLGDKPLPAKLIASTREGQVGDTDFALLKIDNVPAGVKVLSIATEPKPLLDVIAVGYPGTGIRGDANQANPEMVFNRGIVNVVQPQPTGVVWVLHSAEISPGSSGGALVNSCGHLYGVNTFVARGDTAFEGRSLYALSGGSLRKFLDQAGQSYQKTDGQCGSAKPN